MKNVMAILRRDLGAYFTSPIGYIFIMVFVTMSVGLYITSFFAFPVADMRPYFDNLPIFLCVFIPAVTMRIWAEERKENTWEMLLTFPMKSWQLVLGKFFAALIFFCAALLATITVPTMLFSLGDPDLGAVIGGYIGTLLLGAFFLALGVFFSGFFKDQIVAFAVTLLTCFAFFLLGIDFIASYIDGHIAGLGSLLSDVFGIFVHFRSFTRGVIDAADVVFFLVWTVLFLVLNMLYIDGRGRPGAKTVFATAVVLCVAIGLFFNWWMVGRSFGRFDFTEDRIYTVSTASKAILSELDTPVQVKIYITPRDKMPTAMRDLEQDIVDKLEELRVASNDNLEYTTVHLEVANVIADARNPEEEEEKEQTEDEAIEMRMLDKGVEPFAVQALSQDEVTNKLVYSSIGVGYKDKAEEILPRVLPDTLPELEYQLISTIYKLTREKAPVVALVAPQEAFQIDPQMKQMLLQMGQEVPETDDPYVYLQQLLESEKYEVRRVQMTKEDPLPDEYDTLVVVNPRGLNDRQRWEIGRAIHSGKSVVLAVQQYEWDYQITRRGTEISRREENPSINELLESYGLGVSDDILMDVNNEALTIQGGGNSLESLLMGGTPVKLPMHMVIHGGSMSQETALTNRLSAIFYLWGTALELNNDKLAELGLNARPVIWTSDQAWTVAPDATLTADMFEPPAPSEMQAYPVMAMIEGQFPDPYAGKERPEWPKPNPQERMGQPPMPEDNTPEPPATPVEAKPGKMILIGCSELFRKNFLRSGSHLDLFLNSVDAVTLTENLLQVRGSKPVDRTIERPSEGQKTLWRLANYGLANIVIAAIGVGVAVGRRKSRNAYTLGQIRANEK